MCVSADVGEFFGIEGSGQRSRDFFLKNVCVRKEIYRLINEIKCEVQHK